MPDDDLIDLLHTPDSPEPRESDPNRRGSFAAFFIALAFLIPGCWLFFKLKDRPGGIQIAVMVAYTCAIPYITSDRFLNPVPWAHLNRFREKFLLAHGLALTVVYGITTGALAIKPRLPIWVVTSGRKGSPFDFCLLIILLVMALYECSWMSRHWGEQADDPEHS